MAETYRVGRDEEHKTISAAVAKVKAGDRVVIKGGVYREEVNIKASGDKDNPIVIEAAPGEIVVISGADLVTVAVRTGGPAKRVAKSPMAGMSTSTITGPLTATAPVKILSASARFEIL